MQRPENIIYRSSVADDMTSATHGEVVQVAVTEERNCYIVWYGLANMHDSTTNWKPADANPIYWKSDPVLNPRDIAIERGVQAATHYRKVWQRKKGRK